MSAASPNVNRRQKPIESLYAKLRKRKNRGSSVPAEAVNAEPEPEMEPIYEELKPKIPVKERAGSLPPKNWAGPVGVASDRGRVSATPPPRRKHRDKVTPAFSTCDEDEDEVSFENAERENS